MSELDPTLPPLLVPQGDDTSKPVLDHLSGVSRGRREPVSATTVHIGTSTAATIHFPADREPAVAARHATLTQQGRSYLLKAEPGQRVEVNGQIVEAHLLVPGDKIRLGEGGPVLRFRLYKAGRKPYKSIREALVDCADRAREESATPWGRMVHFLRAMPRELSSQTSTWSRGGVMLLMALLLVTTGVLLFRTAQLEGQLARQADAVHTIAGLLEQAEENDLSIEALREIRATLESRVEALEDRGEAGQRVVMAAARSVVFLQGSYGFIEPVSGRPLRIVLGPDGRPAADARGNLTVSVVATGPIFESLYTGTAFVATQDGLLLTNKHVAVPWAFDESAKALVRRGFTATMNRLIGYLPDVKAPFDVELVLASETADVAVLSCGVVTELVSPLPLHQAPAQPGEEVFVLGYPTGMRALLARADESFVDSLMQREGLDFWTMARILSETGHIGPLATRGIVGQVTPARVVYDAETTSGGSGGPVIGLDGSVRAVNAAILVDFGGSNLGVPAAEARLVLDQAMAARSAANPGH